MGTVSQEGRQASAFALSNQNVGRENETFIAFQQGGSAEPGHHACEMQGYPGCAQPFPRCRTLALARFLSTMFCKTVPGSSLRFRLPLTRTPDCLLFHFKEVNVAITTLKLVFTSVPSRQGASPISDGGGQWGSFLSTMFCKTVPGREIP